MMTPIHPHLFLERGLTREEMIEAVRYEGLFGFDPKDASTARALAAEGLVEIGEVREQPVVVSLMDDPR